MLPEVHLSLYDKMVLQIPIILFVVSFLLMFIEQNKKLEILKDKIDKLISLHDHEEEKKS